MSVVATYSLTPYKGAWSKEHLQHLLRRCLFGIGHKELTFFESKTLEQCILVLLRQSPTPDLPIQEDSDVEDPLVPKGEVWINAPYENDLIDNRRGLMLKSWWLGEIINRDYSLTEKMTLFWHNHFVTEMDVVKDSRYSFRYIAMLRKHSLGNFKKLIREGTTNVAMLVYLNGNTNSKDEPNENFSRELLELFTIGKENTQNYTEDDVKAAARVLCGWKDDKEKIQAQFYPELHDTEDKLFSAFFNNHVIKGRKGAEGAAETDELIDLIFEKTETAQFVCRNLYRWFVSDRIDEVIEAKIIEPLSRVFIDADFEIAPVLKTLLSSEHFFDDVFKGCIVKSPVDFFIGAMHQFDVITSCNLKKDHIPWLQFYFYTADLAMDIGNPPSVAGWPAYYQAPKFHQWWVNSASLGFRAKLLGGLCTSEGLIFNGPYVKFDFPTFVHQFKNAGDTDAFIEDCVDLICAVKISDDSKGKLKQLLSGNSSNGWKDVWAEFTNQPHDTKAKEILEDRLRLFF